MYRELLDTSSNLDIYFDDRGWLHCDWKGYQSDRHIKRGCDRMVDWLTATGSTMVLNDNTNVLGLWIESAEWMGSEWFPRMRAAGLKHFAWVYSRGRLSQVSTDEALRHAADGTACVFFHVPEAEEWLGRRAGS